MLWEFGSPTPYGTLSERHRVLCKIRILVQKQGACEILPQAELLYPRINFLHATQRLGRKTIFQGSLDFQGNMQFLQSQVPQTLQHVSMNSFRL